MIPAPSYTRGKEYPDISIACFVDPDREQSEKRTGNEEQG
jgi:hypothetical protein